MHSQRLDGVVHTGHHTFWLTSRTGGYAPTTFTPSNGITSREPGGLRLWTATHTGPVRVRVEVHDAPPPLWTFEQWDEVVDIDVECVTGLLLVTSLLGAVEPQLPNLASSGPGRYRLRIAARGRDSGPPHYDSHAPDEEFLVLSWPTEHEQAERVHRQTDGYGAHLRARG